MEYRVRGLLAFLPDGTMETRNRRGIARDWLRGDAFEAGLRRLAQRLPILWEGTVLGSVLIADRVAGTMAALHGSRYRSQLRFLVFDVPILAGADLRGLAWHDPAARTSRPAFDVPFELSPVVEPDPALGDAGMSTTPPATESANAATPQPNSNASAP
jgi:hypothetical protein